MSWLVGGGQLVVGVGVLVLWWIALRVVRGDGTKPLTAARFVTMPAVFLLWMVGGIVLILHGIGLI